MDVEKKYKRAERRSAQPNTCTSDTPRTSEAEDCRRSSRAAVQCLAVSTFLMLPFADIWFAKRSQALILASKTIQFVRGRQGITQTASTRIAIRYIWRCPSPGPSDHVAPFHDAAQLLRCHK